MYALKGVGQREFYRWLEYNHKKDFPNLNERTRLFRLLNKYHYLVCDFLGQKTVFGVCDSYGTELIHPIREGRSDKQIGRKGKSNKRWIVGSKLAVSLNQYGLIVSWDLSTANVHDSEFHDLVERQNETLQLVDSGFHAREGDPKNMTVCKRGERNERMLVETVFSMMSRYFKMKHISCRVWEYLEARIGYIIGAFNIMVQLFGLKPDENGFIPLHFPQFGL